MKKKIVSLFLVMALMLPMIPVPASAAAALVVPGGIATGVSGVLTSASFATGVSNLLLNAYEYHEGKYTQDSINRVYNCLVAIIGYGQMPMWKLQKKCDTLNAFSRHPTMYYDEFFQTGVNLGYWEDNWLENGALLTDLFNYFTCDFDDIIGGWQVVEYQDGQYVIANSDESFMFSDSLGRYPYASDYADTWFPAEDIEAGVVVAPVPEDALNRRLKECRNMYPNTNIFIGTITLDNGLDYKVIFERTGSDSLNVWCDYEAKPYALPLYDTQAGQDRDYNNDVSDQPLVNEEPVTDIDENFILQMFPDGTFTWIDNIDFTYDDSNKVYNIDASTTYNIEENTYYSYSWSYTYYIDYTSITYIGQTEEYNERYEYYYTLPDGRSSADLTEEELQTLNTTVDVLPYIRSADDTSIRALYHFDGDTLDSSYWSHIGHFDWTTGASITYMDAGAFNGALYLDENEHEYTITLPSNISTGDFTLQFRLYISATLTPVYDSYFAIDNSFKLGINGDAIVTDSATIANLGNGVWQEICAMRKDGILYLFLNGVLVKSWTNYTYVFGDTILFHWGDEQQTFKYFDEFRFVNEAVYETSGYTPASVPFDTNLALVLPDSKLPVADEYWSFVSSYTNLLSSYELDLWIDIGNNPYFSNHVLYDGTGTTKLYYDRSGQGWFFNVAGNGTSYATNFASLGAQAVRKDLAFPYFNSSWVSFTSNESGTVFSNSYLPNLTTTVSYPTIPAIAYNDFHVSGASNLHGWVPYGGILSVLGYSQSGSGSSVSMNGNISFNNDYTLSLVFADGTVKSVSFNLSQLTVSASAPSYVLAEHDNTVFGVSCSSYGNNQYATYWLFVAPKDVSNGASTDSIVYMELIEGSSTDLEAEFVSSVVVMDKDDLRTPSLAVRTDIDITSYQIGGVRPSLPEKGLVWAMVESGRITSLQIYNGQAWEECDGRIWTGQRWIPYYAYDVLLLKDLYDVVGTDPTLNPIYTEVGFWTWLQNAWKDMIARLDKLISVSGGGGTVIPDSSVNFPGDAPNPDTGDDGWQFIDLIVVLKDGTWSIVTGVVNGVFGGFQSLTDYIGNVGGFFQFYSGEDFNVDLGVSS